MKNVLNKNFSSHTLMEILKNFIDLSDSSKVNVFWWIGQTNIGTIYTLAFQQDPKIGDPNIIPCVYRHVKSTHPV